MTTWSNLLADEIKAMRNLVKDYDATNKKPGLFVEYFAYTDKNNIFTASNKRFEMYIPSIDLSWSHETVKPKGSVSYHRLNEHSFADNGKGTI